MKTQREFRLRRKKAELHSADLDPSEVIDSEHSTYNNQPNGKDMISSGVKGNNKEKLNLKNKFLARDWFSSKEGGAPRRCTLPVTLPAESKSILGSEADNVVKSKGQLIQYRLSNEFMDMLELLTDYNCKFYN